MKVLKIFGVFIFSFLCIALIIQRDVEGGENNLAVGLVFGIIAFLLFLSIRHGDKKQLEEAAQQAELIARQNALAKEKEHRVAAIDTLSLDPITEPKLLLKPSEIAYIEQPATLSITENKVVGTTGRSSGVSMRVAKGMYVRTGGSGGRKIYDDVTTTYDGILSITNQRVSFMQDRKAFEIRLDKLTNITYEDDALILQHGNKSYVLLTEDADIMEHLIRKLCGAKSSTDSINSI